VHVKSTEKVHAPIQSQSGDGTAAWREDPNGSEPSVWSASQCTDAMAKRGYRKRGLRVWRRASGKRSSAADRRTRTNGGKIDDAVRDCKKSIEYLTAEAKREIIAELEADYSIGAVCEVLSVNRSSLYDEAVEAEPESDAELKAANASGAAKLFAEIAGEYPTYGDRRVTRQLKRQGIVVNHKRVARLMKEMGIAGKAANRRCRTTNRNHEFARYPNRVAG
jgi:putative transposase